MDPLDFVSSVARTSGPFLLETFGGPHATLEKRPRDIVTEADRASEAAVVVAVRTHFLTAVILGEEGGVYEASGNERFIVDPLDGTTNYAHGYLMFCVSIAYERAGVLEAAAIDAPFLGMHFTARRGGGALLNGRALVAAGRFDAFWEWDLKPWDVAAGALLITEAGGRESAITGQRFDVVAGSLAATNGSLHDELRAALLAAG